MSWKNIPKNIDKYQGFIYVITHKPTGKFYIGKKFFWSKKTRPPLKGRKNKRHYVVESDWKSYWGSSNKLLADIKKYGKRQFERRILRVCESKWDCAFYELQEQLNQSVLFRDDSYNEIINVRLRKRK
jgi:hypothetical protein